MSIHHDWGTHYLGWAYFKNESWTFPLGEIARYTYPVGTNIGFTDSIPIMAIFFKIFAAGLPEDFQYFGIWLFMCYWLIGFYSWRLFSYFRVGIILKCVAVVLIMCNPVLVFRGMHPALCAQWLIIASFDNYFRAGSGHQETRKSNISQTALLIVSSIITPYLTAMIGIFSIIIPLKDVVTKKHLSTGKAIFYPLFAFAGVFIAWFVVGLIGGSARLASTDDFSLYTFNLNGFVNSFGSQYSHFSSGLPLYHEMQYEGFAYLGAGFVLLSVLGLVLIILGYKFVCKILMRHYLLAAVCLLMLLFAFSNKWTLSSDVVFEFDIPDFVKTIYGVFRAPGRFIWPLYYLIIISAFVFCARYLNKFACPVFFLIAIIQLYDVEPLLTIREFKPGTYDTPLNDANWINVLKPFDNVVVYPPFSFNYSMVNHMDYQDLCYLALKAGNKPITNGYTSRINITASQAYRDKINMMLYRGRVSRSSIFITIPDQLPNFNKVLSRGDFSCLSMGDFIAIISSEQKENLKSFADVNRKLERYVDSIRILSPTPQANFRQRPDLFPGDDIDMYFDTLHANELGLSVRGWAFVKGVTDNTGDVIDLVLVSKAGTKYIIPVEQQPRKDVTREKGAKNLDASGFKANLVLDQLPVGIYRAGVLIKNSQEKEFFKLTNKTIKVE